MYCWNGENLGYLKYLPLSARDWAKLLVINVGLASMSTRTWWGWPCTVNSSWVLKGMTDYWALSFPQGTLFWFEAYCVPVFLPKIRSQWLQFIAVKRIQMKSSKGRWHNVTDSKRNHVGKFQLPPCWSPGVSVAGLCTSGNVTWFGNNLIHSLKLPRFGVFVPGKMANTTTRVDLLFYKFLRL